MLNFFQPIGRVHKNYNQYVVWSFLSNIISSTQYVMSTHSMLSTIGKNSTEFNMSYNYICKDVIGQLGGIYYINKTCSKADKDTGKYLRRSLGIQQVSVYLECITPIVPSSLFLGLAGIANTGKNVTATSIGAVNARVIQTLAKEENNIGEIYAKISVMNTLGSSIGMGLGLVLTHYIPEHSTRLCLLPILSIGRIYTFNKAIKDLI